MTPIQIPGPNGPLNVFPELISDPALRDRLLSAQAAAPAVEAPPLEADPVANFIASTQSNLNMVPQLQAPLMQPVAPVTPEVGASPSMPAPAISPVAAELQAIDQLAAPQIAANEAQRASLAQQASLISNYRQQMQADMDADKVAQQTALDRYNQAQKDLEAAKAKSKAGFWADRTMGQKIAAGLGLVLGGAVAGATGRENQTTQILLNALQEDADKKLAMIESADRNVARERQYLDVVQQRFATRPQQRLALLDLNLQEAQKQAEAAALRAKTPEIYQNAMNARNRILAERQKTFQDLMKGEIDIAKGMRELQGAQALPLRPGADPKAYFEQKQILDQEQALLGNLAAARKAGDDATVTVILNQIARTRATSGKDIDREMRILEDADIKTLLNDVAIRRRVLDNTFLNTSAEPPNPNRENFLNQFRPNTGAPGAL